MSSVNRALVEELLDDESLSFREIARIAGCSDWSVRSIASQRRGNGKPTKASRYQPSEIDGDESAPPHLGLTLAAIGIVGVGLIWAACRRPGS